MVTDAYSALADAQSPSSLLVNEVKRLGFAPHSAPKAAAAGSNPVVSAENGEFAYAWHTMDEKHPPDSLTGLRVASVGTSRIRCMCRGELRSKRLSPMYEGDAGHPR